jgi:acetoacetyl-CoA synthetase
MDVCSFDDSGKPSFSKKGELVCKKPFPSMPIYFWNDPDGSLYNKAYFNRYKGIWTHGDYILINDNGGVIIYGRSDSTLNPGGVRIGTSEIYKVVDKISGIIDCVVVGKVIKGDEQIILFLKMNIDLDDNIEKEIKTKLRKQCSPRHIPYRIIRVDDIPYTLNGKKVEVAVKKIINGEEILNKESIINPESLNFFKKISI